jgi:hypothetical protein
MFIATILLISILFLPFILNVKHTFDSCFTHESVEEAKEKKTALEQNNKKKIEYIRTITNQYFLRSINDFSRRWPHPKRRPK